MTFGSLFSGIGGMDLGLERAGMTCRWQVEIDPFCNQVLEKHWPGVRRYGDIRTVTVTEPEHVDVVAGGFPCQPVSRAGSQLRQRDDRWLWPEYFRLVRHLRPRVIIVENVPGLLDGGMGDVLGALAEIRYSTEWCCFPASASVGTPHIRDRVWIIAYAERAGLPTNLLASGGTPNSRTKGASGFWDNGWMHESSGFHGRWVDATPEAKNAAAAWEYAPCEPLLLGIPDGVSGRVDRIKSIGNSVVPQVAEWIGRRIMEANIA